MTIPRLYADDAPSSGRGPDRSPDTEKEARARVGQILASKYRLDDVVGSGGMGHVYRATNTAIGRRVAIKLLRPELVQHPEIVERFLREARTANRVNHPNVVDVTDIGQEENGTPFMVQEFLEGETLLDFTMRQGGKLTLSDVAEIIGPVLDAVAEAHAGGIVHRDLKPENVFLADKRGQRIPKILDFGISKVRESDVEATKAGVMMGTPAYLPPELVVSFRDADTRSDVWSLGVIIFELLAGRVPFEGDTVGEVFNSITTKDADRLSQYADVPEALADVVARCLKRDPAERYPDALALAIDLSRTFERYEAEAAKPRSLRPTDDAAPATVNDRSKPPVPVDLGADRVGRGGTIPLIPKSARSIKPEEAAPVAELEAARGVKNDERAAASSSTKMILAVGILLAALVAALVLFTLRK